MLFIVISLVAGLNRYAPTLMGNNFPEREGRLEREKVLTERIEELERQGKWREDELNRQIRELQLTVKVLTEQADASNSRIGELKSRISELEREIAVLQRKNDIKPHGHSEFYLDSDSPLLVAIGSDTALKIDLASFRAVRTESGLNFLVIENATLEKIKQHLNRQRMNGHPTDKLHLAVHSGAQGILLGNALVDAVQFSEILDGVKVLLLAGCEGEVIGDYLGIVRYVVTMSEKVPMDDAAFFARAFWTEVGNQKEPGEALKAALRRSPSGMSEYVIRHF